MEIILQEFMHLEEELLLCENQQKFTMPFQDYIILDKFLTEVENITNLYFQLITDYNKEINKLDIKNDERVEKMQTYNQKLLEEKVKFDFEPYREFMGKWKIKI